MSRVRIPTDFLEKVRFVSNIFTDNEREYDLLLRLMTVGFDWVWRRRLFSKIVFSPGIHVLDLACGTGLVTFGLAALAPANGLIVGLDLSPDMLEVANRKKRRFNQNCSVELVRAVGELLPFRDGVFQYVTIGLALRNFGDLKALFQETLRILTSHGWLLSLDFVLPKNSKVERIYSPYIFHIMPSLGRLVSAHWQRTLIYLANSIQISKSSESLNEMLRSVGFSKTFSEKMTVGVVALIGAQKKVSSASISVR